MGKRQERHVNVSWLTQIVFYSPIYRVSVECRSNVGRMSVKCRSNVDRMSVECQLYVDRMSVECRSNVVTPGLGTTDITAKYVKFDERFCTAHRANCFEHTMSITGDPGAKTSITFDHQDRSVELIRVLPQELRDRTMEIKKSNVKCRVLRFSQNLCLR